MTDQVLITGANKGIGLATALLLGRSGYTVHATMRDLGRSRELSDAAEKERMPVRISAMDVDSDSSVRESIATIQRTYWCVTLSLCATDGRTVLYRSRGESYIDKGRGRKNPRDHQKRHLEIPSYRWAGR